MARSETAKAAGGLGERACGDEPCAKPCRASDQPVGKYFPGSARRWGVQRAVPARGVGHAWPVGTRSYHQQFDALTLKPGANEAAHFDSGDLELGGAGSGLSGSTGPGISKSRADSTSRCAPTSPHPRDHSKRPANSSPARGSGAKPRRLPLRLSTIDVMSNSSRLRGARSLAVRRSRYR